MDSESMAERAWIRGAVVERVERVVPAAEARLVLVERLHRAHARRRHQRRRLPARRELLVVRVLFAVVVERVLLVGARAGDRLIMVSPGFFFRNCSSGNN
jgi:hypothetical protein